MTSPPAQNALPAPVTISARSGARSASQAKATVISTIISGLIALKASGRFEGQGPDLAVDLDLQRLQLGWAQGLGVISLSVSGVTFGRVARSLPFGG